MKTVTLYEHVHNPLINRYGALPLCRVGLPSTCRAIKKKTESRTLGFERTCPRPQIFLIFSPFRCHLLTVLTGRIPGVERASTVFTAQIDFC
jgi:hypothetical protein